jgi:hypothetical protein
MRGWGVLISDFGRAGTDVAGWEADPGTARRVLATQRSPRREGRKEDGIVLKVALGRSAAESRKT